MRAGRQILDVRSAERLGGAGEAAAETGPRWTRAALAGRIVELGAPAASAALTMAFALVLDAQREGEPAAWVETRASGFFPPDAARAGADLAALVVVRAPDAQAVPRVADRLLRSGAFGLVVLDLGAERRVEMAPATQTRLQGLVRKHDAVLLVLARKPPSAPSIGSLVSLRAEARRERDDGVPRRCVLRILKDKRHGPGWCHEERCRGPVGLH